MRQIAVLDHWLAAADACSREGAGLGEALVVLGVLLAAGLLLALLLAVAIGGTLARRRGRPWWRGAMVAGGGLLGSLLAIVATLLAVQLLQEWDERREREQVAHWLRPLDAVAAGQLRRTLDRLRAQAPPFSYAPARLGYELQQRLIRRPQEWSDDDLAAANAYAPAPVDMHGAIVWARHGLAGLDPALAEVGSRPEDLALLAHHAAWFCSADVPRCRMLTRDASWQRLHTAIVDGFPPPRQRADLQLLVGNVRQRVATEPAGAAQVPR